MREDCLDLLTRLPTMPLLGSGSAPTRDLAPLWLGKACIERWWRSSDQFCEAASSFARLRRGGGAGDHFGGAAWCLPRVRRGETLVARAVGGVTEPARAARCA